MSNPTEQTLADRIRHALALIEVAIVEAKKTIETQPDNPAVARKFGGSKSAFVVSSKVLTDTSHWDVFFHDWASQYKYAADLLEKRKFSAVDRLLTGHSYHDPSLGVKSFAPEVIQKVAAITGDLRHAMNRLGGPSTLNAEQDASQIEPQRKTPRPMH